MLSAQALSQQSPLRHMVYRMPLASRTHRRSARGDGLVEEASEMVLFDELDEHVAPDTRGVPVVTSVTYPLGGSPIGSATPTFGVDARVVEIDRDGDGVCLLDPVSRSHSTIRTVAPWRSTSLSNRADRRRSLAVGTTRPADPCPARIRCRQGLPMITWPSSGRIAWGCRRSMRRARADARRHARRRRATTRRDLGGTP
jgi:hypothetical protein